MGVLLCPLCRGEPIRWESQLGQVCGSVFILHVHVAVMAVCRQARCRRKDSCCTFGVCRLFYPCCQCRRAAAGPKSAATRRMMTTILVSSHLPCRYKYISHDTSDVGLISDYEMFCTGWCLELHFGIKLWFIYEMNVFFPLGWQQNLCAADHRGVCPQAGQ